MPDMVEKSDKIQTLIELLKNAKSPVFFGGAGVSTESGIPDFRSVDGLYNQKYDFPPETILSHTFFMNKTAEFYRFYYDKMMIDNVEPNYAHIFLAQKNIPIITQNIDGLHQKAGSKDVFELHGSIHRNNCVMCKKFFGLEKLKELIEKSSDSIPRCDECEGIIKPDVVLYEEPLNSEVWEKAVEVLNNADLLIIGGTSLTVYPAASLIHYFKSENIVLINKSSTASDSSVKLIIDKPIGEVFKVCSDSRY